MTNITDFQGGVTDALSFGQRIRLKYYTPTFAGSTIYGAGSYYDDDVTLAQSGADLWTSGLIMPLTGAKGSNDAMLLEQGKILTDDTKLYISGNINTSGIIKIGLGSSTTGMPEYSILSEGISQWTINQSPIYKKLYIRLLLTGSFIGE